jgi:splicing factor 1
MARDCQANKRDPNLPPGVAPPPSALNGNNSMIKGGGFDSEYERLMAELGESGKESAAIAAPGQDITGGGLNVPPWRRPDVWAPPQAPPQQNQGYRPPQQGTFGSSMWAQAGFQQYSAYEQQQQQQQPDYYGQFYQQQYSQYPQGYAQQA